MNRILIIRPSAIGDIVMASPMINSLRRQHPHAHIAWLADPVAGELLQDHPGLNEVIEWSKADWRQSVSSGRLFHLMVQVRSFRRQLHLKQFDTVIDIQGLFRSRLLAWLTGAKHRIGFDSHEPGKFLMTRILSKGPSTKEMGGEYLFMLTSLGITPVLDQPSIILSGEVRKNAMRKMADAGIGQPYAVFCPFTTRPQKHWFDDRWVQLTDLLWRQYRMPVVLLGGADDGPHSRRIAAHHPESIRSLAGTTRLGESAAIVQDAALLIGVDTGLTHMGTAFLRPTIALFGATCPYLSTANPLTRIVYERLACSPCKRKPTCDGRYDCMKAITAEAVYETARALLQQAGHEPHADSSY